MRFLQFCALLLLSAASVMGQGVLDIVDTNESPLQRAKRAREELAQRLQDDRFNETLEVRIARLKRELAAAESEFAKRVEAELKSAEAEVSTEALVVVKSYEASYGAGFIAEMRGRTFLITNIHVLGAARGASIQTLEGIEVSLPLHGYISRWRDVVIVPIEWQGPTLPLSQALSFDEVEVGQDVTVLGLPGADDADVIRLQGRLLSVAEHELEVQTKSVPRNSGSPIIHDSSGQVIAMVSHYQDQTVRPRFGHRGGNEAGAEGERPVVRDIRCFGARLDGDVEWRRIGLSELYKQAEIFRRYEERTQVMSRVGTILINQIQGGGRDEPTLKYQLDEYEGHDSLGYLFDHFERDFQWYRGTNSSNNQRQLKRFVMGMLSELQTDRQSTQEALSIDFYQRRYLAVEGARDRTVKNLVRFSDSRLD